MKNKKMERLLKIIDTAIVGKNYSKDIYDIERFEQIIELSSILLEDASDISKEMLLC